ncbi:MAG: adenylate/guanylate cyclase domain-containing protein [Gammaproteobacteria bacterium]|nr:adenylate/guanylate cyclase domain-containing protein [Gammaproteobacteria bacterium]MBU1625497.1 adenylate/guanylate cyclase domain-containing protein [Gammaproteobacteria bacterium]MBU1980757.1 adenylate/guanylate cyclase domain-containing protein [Gammaproteobacteria bacterium]
MKKHALLIMLGMFAVLLFLGDAAGFYRLGFVQYGDAQLYDYRLRLSLPNKADDRIVILDIDEKSLKQEGRWPWSRDKMARLMDSLFDEYGVAAVGFDVVFAEPDNSSGLNVLQALGAKQFRDVEQFQTVLNQIKPSLQYDALFAEKLKGRKVVLGYYFSNSEGGKSASKSGALPEAVFSADQFRGRTVGLASWDGFGANLSELQSSAASAGHFNPLVDFDGVVRRIPMLVEHEGRIYESLSLAVVRSVLDMPKLTPGFAGEQNKGYGGLEWLSVESAQGGLTIPVDAELSALIPYRGLRNTFKYISVTDVLHGRTELPALQNKIVLVGTSAPGLMDMRSTPVGEVYPGVEVHANMISGILNQDIKQHPPYMLGANVVLMLFIGICLSALLPLLSPIRGMLLSLIFLSGDVALNLALWNYADLAMPMAGGILIILTLFALNMSFGYFVESRAKRQITGLFGQYVPGELVDEMAKRPESVSMEGDSREMTILFSDVRSFTTISEGLDPKELSLLMNEFLTPLSRVIYKQRGTIDKYMGDCIMAFWGAPLPDLEHAQHAVLAGMEMQRALNDLQPQFKARGWPEIHIGVGVNTGRVSVGNMGSEVRVAYTVMGDAVNLASRLEGITKEYGVLMLVGESTKQATPQIVYREVDLVRVKGKEQPVAIFEPHGLSGEVEKSKLDEIKLFHQALRTYRKQDWDKADLELLSLQNMSPDCKLYRVYAERVTFYRNNPPGEDWDGVFTFKTK